MALVLKIQITPLKFLYLYVNIIIIITLVNIIIIIITVIRSYIIATILVIIMLGVFSLKKYRYQWGFSKLTLN